MIWLFWLLFIAFDALYNHLRITDRQKINHYVNGLYRCAIVSLFVWIFHLQGLELLMFALGGFFSFWLLFNFLLNWLQGWGWDYLGSTSILDRFESSAPLFFLWAKVVLSAGFIYAFYHIDLL